VDIKLQRCDLHLLLRQALDTAAAAAENKGLRIESHLHAARSIVNADPQRLNQVFWNLLGNALKFTSSGGLIEVFTDNPSRDTIRMRVTDTGIGIAPEHLPLIFEPFERGETRHRYEYTGLGLGLSIARSLLELMNGSIDAHSDGLGRGATFVVTLPAADSVPPGTPTPAPPDTATRRPAEPPGTRREPSVLVVEDHQPTAQILARLLRRGGRRVAVAASASEARQIVAVEPAFDLLLCDIGLPDESGHDLLRSLRQAGVTAPAIALSGFGMDRDISASRAAGFVEHLVKPIDFRALEDAIVRAVSTGAA
jgi:CheY-like chemotaxis protein